MSLEHRAQRAPAPRWPGWRMAALAFLIAAIGGWRFARQWLARAAMHIPYYEAQPILFAGTIGERFPDRSQSFPAWSLSFVDTGDWFRPICGVYNMKPEMPIHSPGDAGLRYFILNPNLDDCGGFLSRNYYIESRVCEDWDSDGYYELPLIVSRDINAGSPASWFPHVCAVRIRPTVTEIVAIVEELPCTPPHANRWVVQVQPPRAIGGGMHRLFLERYDRTPWAGMAPPGTAAPPPPAVGVRLGGLKWTRPGGTLRAVGEWAPELRAYTPPIDQPWILPPETKLQDMIEKIIAEEQPQTPDPD